jgi:hypothetical protein
MAIDLPPARVSVAVAASTAAQADLQAAVDATSAEAAAAAAEEPRDAAVSAPAVSAAASGAEGPAASQEGNSSENTADPKGPVWLYINHLGWCRWVWDALMLADGASV